eukprot:CAMPEP_0184652666 /NCGR_PEP_ID=MMETSP0308-20130426/10370_1 /TAXON_ID=38269 /ORGANISM="Gloeochaete witrockiana, Strain SAG 46.84" /LENGTH=625 /DNA_ID=CAMNT_0027087677 /DNA_START=201 /DNA_END=2078 /DNA_ORIENTATION=-
MAVASLSEHRRSLKGVDDDRGEEDEEEEDEMSDDSDGSAHDRKLLAARPKRTPTKKRKPTPSKKRAPTKKVKRTPTRKVKRTPTRKVKRTPTRKVKRTPTRKVKRTPTRKVQVGPTRKAKPTRTPRRLTPRRPVDTRPPQAIPFSQYAPLTVRYTIGSPEYVYHWDPNNAHYPDQALCVTRLKNGDFRGYSAKGRADLVIAGPKLGKVLNPKHRLNLLFNPKAYNYWTHDIEGVWTDANDDIHAWVHLELTTNDPTSSWIYGVVAYAKSTNGGYSFFPNGFLPQHYVLTSAGPFPNRRKSVGIGKNWVVQVDDYLFQYFVDFWAEGPNGQHLDSGICMARSTVACQGAKGDCWTRWYRGRWDPAQKGIGGRCSQVPNLFGTAVTRIKLRNTDNQYLYVSVPDSYDRWSAVSRDGETWSALEGYKNEAPFDWLPKTYKSNWNLAYCSVLEDELAKNWLYCAVVTEESRGLRAIARWPIAFSRAVRAGCSGRIALTKWQRRGGAETRVAWQPIDERVWVKKEIIGYTSVCQGAYLVTLLDCLDPSTKTHYIGLEGQDCFVGKKTIHTSYGSGRVEPREGLVPLFRCKQGRYYDHSTGAPCGANAVLVAYVYPYTANELDWMDVSLPI